VKIEIDEMGSQVMFLSIWVLVTLKWL